MKLTIVVLAAGQGVRMKSELPKVMHLLAGRPMIGHVLETAATLQPTELMVVVGHGANLVCQALGARARYVVQEQRLGTGHAVAQASAQLAGRADAVLVLYSDTPLIRPATLMRVIDHHVAAGDAVTLLTFRPDDPTGYGRIARNSAGEVQAIVEEAVATEEQRRIGEVNSGIACFRDGWLWANLPRLERRPGGEYYLTDLVDLARRQGVPVSALEACDPLEMIGVDDRVKLSRAEAEMHRRINERWMRAGVTLIHPETTFIEAGVEIGPDTVIWPNSFLQGSTCIGRQCTIGPGSVIRDTAVGDRCRVELSVLEGAVMEDDSDIGPFSHLRKGARLAAGSHVGNFAELKNSTLGPEAKMGHMSYLGDATVGARVNIGAGTITCNFDGERKNRTVIGQDAFIGSDTMLVAPVEIGAGAKTGAGSVVTRDVPAGGLVMGVPARPRRGDAGPGETGPAGHAADRAEGT